MHVCMGLSYDHLSKNTDVILFIPPPGGLVLNGSAHKASKMSTLAANLAQLG